MSRAPVGRAALALALGLLLGGRLAAQDPGPTPPSTSNFGGGLLGGFSDSDAPPVTVKLRAGEAPAVGEAFELALILEHAAGYHTYAPTERLGAPVEVTPRPTEGIEWGAPLFPPGRKKDFPLLGGSLELYEGSVEVRLPGRITREVGRTTSFSIGVVYSACTDQACLLPRELEVPGTWGAGGSTPEAISPGGPAAVPAPPGAAGDDFARTLRSGLLWALLVAYAWGLAASISPCVYPMIPVTIAFFGSQSEGRSRARTALLALAYVAGIVVTYALAGLAAARLGRDVGALLVNPWVVGTVAAMLFGMGLSLFGVFEMSLPFAVQERLNQASDGRGPGSAFATGAVLGLVAAPCVGPFAASILIFVARSGDLLVGALALGSFGLGIGTLFLVLAMGISELPKSGTWLITVKKLFGWVLFGAAFYFLSQVLAPEWTLIGWGVWLGLGGVVGGALEPARGSGEKAAQGAMLLALVSGVYLLLAGLSQRFPLKLAGAAPAPHQVAGEAVWLDDIEDARGRAAATGKPIFADFFADWCIPCKQMEAEVFPEASVRAALEDFVLARLDCTDPDSAPARLKNRELGVPSMPYLAVFDAKGRHRPDLSHPGYLGVDEFRALLVRARAALSGA